MTAIDILSLGELIVDLLPAGVSDHQQPLYEFNPGGAPANVASAAARLGLNTGLIAKVGNDAFGRMLFQSMQNKGIQSDGIVFSQFCPTSLAIVHLNPNGDRSFSLFAQNPADMDLNAAELPDHLLKNCRFFHFGARSLVAQPARDATLHAIATARASGAKISFDPNLRPNLWNHEEDARADALLGVIQADLVKLALEEMVFLYGTQDVRSVLQTLNEQRKTAVVTDGANGCFVWSQEQMVHVPAYTVHVVDTTGAGDAFWTAFLYQQLQQPDASLPDQLRFASAAGALVTSKKGSMGAQPTADEVTRFMEEYDNE